MNTPQRHRPLPIASGTRPTALPRPARADPGRRALPADLPRPGPASRRARRPARSGWRPSRARRNRSSPPLPRRTAPRPGGARGPAPGRGARGPPELAPAARGARAPTPSRHGRGRARPDPRGRVPRTAAATPRMARTVATATSARRPPSGSPRRHPAGSRAGYGPPRRCEAPARAPRPRPASGRRAARSLSARASAHRRTEVARRSGGHDEFAPAARRHAARGADLVQLDLGPVHRKLHRIGEPHLAGWSLVLEAGGDVDRLAEDVSALEPHLTEVDGHADDEAFGVPRLDERVVRDGPAWPSRTARSRWASGRRAGARRRWT